MSLRWRDDSELPSGVRQRVFTVARDEREVPGVVWTPARPAGPAPLALIGHGGAGHKLDDSRIDFAQRYVVGHGVAAAAIDGPWHGERQPSPAPNPPSITASVVDAMVADWRAALDALCELPEVDPRRIGYGGVSVGTMFGLPFVAAESRIRASVFGLCGLRQPGGEPLAMADRLARDAREVRCPVLFLAQWDDELFERSSVLELFDLLGSPEKRLLASTGKHHQTPHHAREASTTFLAGQLLSPSA